MTGETNLNIEAFRTDAVRRPIAKGILALTWCVALVVGGEAILTGQSTALPVAALALLLAALPTVSFVLPHLYKAMPSASALSVAGILALLVYNFKYETILPFSLASCVSQHS